MVLIKIGNDDKENQLVTCLCALMLGITPPPGLRWGFALPVENGSLYGVGR